MTHLNNYLMMYFFYLIMALLLLHTNVLQDIQMKPLPLSSDKAATSESAGSHSPHACPPPCPNEEGEQH